MPREAYTSEAVLAEERERVFARGWNCVGRASRWPSRATTWSARSLGSR